MAAKNRRLSLQICRIMGIIQVLHFADKQSPGEGGMTAYRIHLIVNECLPKPVCARTIRRDLESLVAMGFAEVYKAERLPRLPKQNRFWRLYRIASPVILQSRFRQLGLKALGP